MFRKFSSNTRQLLKGAVALGLSGTAARYATKCPYFMSQLQQFKMKKKEVVQESKPQVEPEHKLEPLFPPVGTPSRH